jgi:hypothetical protein
MRLGIPHPHTRRIVAGLPALEPRAAHEALDIVRGVARRLQNKPGRRNLHQNPPGQLWPDPELPLHGYYVTRYHTEMYESTAREKSGRKYSFCFQYKIPESLPPFSGPGLFVHAFR